MTSCTLERPTINTSSRPLTSSTGISSDMNSQQISQETMGTLTQSGGGTGPYSNAMLERLMQHSGMNGCGTPGGSSSNTPAPGGSLPLDSGGGPGSASSAAAAAAAMMNSHQQEFLSAQVQRDRRMLAALQQQQQQQQQHRQQQQLASRNGLPVLTSMAGPHQRFMVDEFAGAGSLLSRPEQDYLLSRFGSLTAGHHHRHHPALGSLAGNPDLDISHGSKLADLLLAKQAAALNGMGAMAATHRLPKVTRLPCQARGMKADHNSSTAFFEIPDDARHGQHLLCSHPACRSAGVKFRYCLYCKKPVTKQNFRSRHLHADLDPNSKECKNDNKAPTNNDRKRASPDAGLAETGGLPAAKSAKVSTSDEADLAGPLNKNGDDSTSTGKVGRRRRWTLLYNERPTSLDMMHSWLGKVLGMSDPKKSSNSSSDNPETDDDDGYHKNATSQEALQQTRWNALLDKRPHIDAGDAAATKWLVEVLEASCREAIDTPAAIEAEEVNVDKE